MKINYETSNITLDGIEYLKQNPKIIENEIIQILHDSNYDKALTDSHIKKKISFRLKYNQVETYLKRLEDKGFVKVENGFITSINRNDVIEKISKIADNTAKTNELLESIAHAFDITLNAM